MRRENPAKRVTVTDIIYTFVKENNEIRYRQ